MSTSVVAGLSFSVEVENFELYSVDVYPEVSGDLEIAVVEVGSSGTIASHIETVPASPSDPVTINLDFDDLNLEPGKQYNLVQVKPLISLSVDPASEVEYPYELGNNGAGGREYGVIDQGVYKGFSPGPGTREKWYHFYNWKIGVKEIMCESDREEIEIRINDDHPADPDIDSPYTLCGEGVFTLQDIDIKGNDIQWLNESGNSIPDTTEVGNGDEYFVLDESPGGCKSDIVSVEIFILDISDQPIADSEQTFEEGETLADLEVTGVDLQWYADTDKEEELPNDTELVDETTYYVTQTQEDFCESEVVGITVSEEMGIDNANFNGFKAFPNPVRDVLALHNQKPIGKVKLYDFNGRKLSAKLKYNNDGSAQVNLSGLNSGIYFLEVTVDKQVKMVRIIKE